MKKLLLIAPLILASACAKVEDTEVCFKKRLGIYNENILKSGLNAYNPFTTDVICIDRRIQRHTGEMKASTRDLQPIDITFFVNWRADADNGHALHRTLGGAYRSRLSSETESSIAAVIGRYNAAGLIANRVQIEQEATELLNKRLNALYMKADSIRIERIGYTREYAAAIEATQVAEQAAARERNVTIQQEEKAKQILVEARANAEAMRIKTNALAQSKTLIEYERVQVEKIQAERWNGVLPAQIFGPVPLPIMNISK